MPKIRYIDEEIEAMFKPNPDWKDAPFEEYTTINVGPPPKTVEYMSVKEMQEMLARLTPEPSKQPAPEPLSPIAVNFNETEINGPEDMLMEIVRLKGILNAILAAWNKSTTMPPDLTEKELFVFIKWIKDHKEKEEEKHRNQYPFDNPKSLISDKSQNQIDNENWAKKIYR